MLARCSLKGWVKTTGRNVILIKHCARGGDSAGHLNGTESKNEAMGHWQGDHHLQEGLVRQLGLLFLKNKEKPLLPCPCCPGLSLVSWLGVLAKAIPHPAEPGSKSR